MDNIDVEIHLGKRSSGWQFCWEAHPEYYEDNLQSIKKFLSKDNIVIYNEYGEEFTLDQFIKKEIGKAMYNDPENYINDEQYCKKYNESYIYTRPELYWTSKDGLRFQKGEFC